MTAAAAQIVIAARGGPDAKTRLAGVLTPDERDGLAAAMLEVMLRRLGPARCRVVSPTDSLLDLAAAFGAAPLRQTGGDLNAAFDQARADLDGPAVLLPGDLPLIQAEDLDAVIAAIATHDLVLSPAAADGGTACLAMTEPLAYPTRFGPDSFRSHRLQARERGLHVAVVRRPSLGLDIDRPEDLPQLDRLARQDAAFGAFWRGLDRPVLRPAI